MRLLIRIYRNKSKTLANWILLFRTTILFQQWDSNSCKQEISWNPARISSFRWWCFWVLRPSLVIHLVIVYEWQQETLEEEFQVEQGILSLRIQATLTIIMQEIIAGITLMLWTNRILLKLTYLFFQSTLRKFIIRMRIQIIIHSIEQREIVQLTKVSWKHSPSRHCKATWVSLVGGLI